MSTTERSASRVAVRLGERGRSPVVPRSLLCQVSGKNNQRPPSRGDFYRRKDPPVARGRNGLIPEHLEFQLGLEPSCAAAARSATRHQPSAGAHRSDRRSEASRREGHAERLWRAPATHGRVIECERNGPRYIVTSPNPARIYSQTRSPVSTVTTKPSRTSMAMATPPAMIVAPARPGSLGSSSLQGGDTAPRRWQALSPRHTDMPPTQ